MTIRGQSTKGNEQNQNKTEIVDPTLKVWYHETTEAVPDNVSSDLYEMRIDEA